MLAAGIVQTRLLEKLEKAKEAKRRRLEATSTATYTFLSSEFHSQNTHARMRIRNRCTYIYISRDSIDMTK